MSEWHDIEAESPPELAIFWIRPKTADEAYQDSSGKPITAKFAPHYHIGTNRSWSTLSKATHWAHLPDWMLKGPASQLNEQQ